MKPPVREFEALYAAHYRPVVGLLVALGGSPSDAEDVAQESFVKLLGRWRRISRYDDPGAWVRLVAARAMVSHLRTRRRRGEIEDAMIAPTRGAAWADRVDDRLALGAAIDDLPLHQRQVVVLHHALGLPVNDVARTLRIPPGTVQSRLSRARATLNAALQNEENQHA
jgi:RNA polymerase sigma-70 factor (ECF subfamily)